MRREQVKDTVGSTTFQYGNPGDGLLVYIVIPSLKDGWRRF